jgi:hypothetical protein
MNGNEENESFYREADEDTGAEQYQLEDPMTFWKKEKESLWKKISGRAETPFVLMGVGFVLVVVIFFAFFPRGDGALPDNGALLDRLQQIEEKVGRMETALHEFTAIQEDMEPVKKAILRFDSADASMAANFQRLAEEVASLKKEMAALEKSRSAGAKTSAAAPQPEKTEAASKAGYHEVVKGDTLYSISRRYGVSVDAIRKLNGLSGQDAIHPGQKLKVKE